MLVPHGTHVRISTRTLVATVSSHTRIIYDSSCPICMFYGRELRSRNKVQPTTVMKLLWDFAYVPKGSYRWELHLLFGLFICNGSLNSKYRVGRTFSSRNFWGTVSLLNYFSGDSYPTQLFFLGQLAHPRIFSFRHPCLISLHHNTSSKLSQ